MTEQPSLNIEGLARFDLRPDEILAVTLGIPDLKPYQLQEFEQWLTAWLHEHGKPVAGVLVLPQGSGIAAIRAPEPVTVNVDFSGTVLSDKQIDQLAAEFAKRQRREPPGQH